MKLWGILPNNYSRSEKTNFKVIRICYKMHEEGQHSQYKDQRRYAWMRLDKKATGLANIYPPSLYTERPLSPPRCQEIRNKGLQGLTDPGGRKLIALNNSGTVWGIMWLSTSIFIPDNRSHRNLGKGMAGSIRAAVQSMTTQKTTS